ncbi:MAG TPA: insulinase family protein, partial [Caulobacter sp.]|nr:insulinase family protein [Caulobacter sp.]
MIPRLALPARLPMPGISLVRLLSLAHFLEHMAFNGSKGIPEGEMVKMLERQGLAFGADTNASTDFEETVYKLDLPRTDDATVDLSLKVMRETASELLIDPAAVDRERGVVLSEERTRDSPGWRVFKARLRFILKGQRPPERWPIGTVDILKNAPASEISAYYRTWYRPERATLIAVGDFDVDAMEAKIKAAFGDWRNAHRDGQDPAMGPVARRGLETMVVVEPGSSTTLQIGWVAPVDLTRDTQAKRRRQWTEQLGFSVLNRRLEALARGGDAPFLSAGAFSSNQVQAARVTTVAVTARPGAWQSALAAVEQEQRRAVTFGVRQDELDREIEEYRQALKTRAAAAATRRTPGLANELVGSLGEDDIITSPAQDLALFEAVVKDLKAATVSDALKGAFAGAGPLVFVATPTPIEGAEAAVAQAFEASRKLAVTAPEAPRQIAWPYGSFGPAGKVAEQTEVTDLDTVFVRFENGVRLTVKPTRFRDDQVLVKVRIGDGLMALPADRQSMFWAHSAVVEGGLAKISAEDMERVLASRVYSARFGVDDDAFVLTGGTRPEDLDVQLQVLAAYASEPGWRPEAFQRARTYAGTLSEQWQATDGGVFNRDLAGLLHNGDRRWTWPSAQDIASARPEDLKASLDAALTTGGIEVVIVGDITVDKAIEAIAATFGALGKRPEVRLAPPASVGFPAPVAAPVVLTHGGRDDQSVAYIAWRTDDFYADVQKARNVALLGDVIDLRLTQELRENQGATYSPSVGWNASDVWTDWGYLSARVEIPPPLVEGFYRDVKRIAADL